MDVFFFFFGLTGFILQRKEKEKKNRTIESEDEFDNISPVHYQWPELMLEHVNKLTVDNEACRNNGAALAFIPRCDERESKLNKNENIDRCTDRCFGFTLGYLLAKHINKLSGTSLHCTMTFFHC